MAEANVLAFDGVTIEHRGRRGAAIRILDDVSFSVAPGTAFGLVGESGCGKSTAALAAMHYLPAGMGIAKGRVDVLGRDIATLSARELRDLRGNRIAMIYQDPMSSLNPVMTIGAQLIEVPLLHGETSTAKARERAIAMLAEVRLADPAAAMERYPHELSGGQQQRVVIAMALMAEPALLIMDEPTTGLDVTIEAAILELVRDLRVRFGAAVLFISHNLGAVARVCDHIGVLYAGRMVETGPIGDVLKRPAHPYTRGLLRALPGGPGSARGATLEPIPGIVSASDRARIGCAFAARCAHHRAEACDDRPIGMRTVAASPVHFARCARLVDIADGSPARATHAAPPSSAGAGQAGIETGGDVVLAVRELSKVYRAQGMFSARGPAVKAATDVSFEARRGTTLAIVGESGCGKSTVAKIVAGLVEGSGGEAMMEGVNLATTAVDRRPWELRRRVQMVFQNPDSTLNPSHTVEYALSRPLRRLKGLSRRQARAEVEQLAERVRLPADLLTRLPHQLSGGQRQRVAIARALAGDPEILVADEPVSALDVSVQAAIVNLLQELQQRSQLSLVVISHDLALVRHMADWIAVMYLGHVVEYGPAAQVLAPPYHPYTEALLAAAPIVDPEAPPPAIVLGGTMPSPSAELRGCPFAGRCPRKVGPVCDTTPPPERRYGQHTVACHAQQ